MKVIQGHGMQRSGPGQTEIMPRPGYRYNKLGRVDEMTPLKLPALQSILEAQPPEISADLTGSHVTQQTTPSVNLSRLTHTEAITLLDQYNKLVGDESKVRPAVLPRIKQRHEERKHVPARQRFYTKSLDRVERSGRKVFTEGLSSKSKPVDPPLAMRRRDILGANMPETVRLARERSKIAFGLGHYQTLKQKEKISYTRRRTLKGLHIEPASVTANQITAPLAQLPIKEEDEEEELLENIRSKSESRITKMLHSMEERYGKDVIGRHLSSSPSVHSVDYLTSSTTLTTPTMTPRRTPRQIEKSKKPSLSVVSFGEALANLPQRPRPSVKLPSKTRDINFERFERFRQHADDKKVKSFENKYSSSQNDGKDETEHYYIELKSTNQKRKKKPKIKKRIVVSLKELNTPVQDDDEEDSEDEKDDNSPAKGGSFDVEGVKGHATATRLWSAGSISTSASVANPPPSAEAGHFDLEFPNFKDPAAIFDSDTVLDSARLTRSSDKSSLLSVPSLKAKSGLPNIEHIYGERPPMKDDPLAGLDFEADELNDFNMDYSPRNGSVQIMPDSQGSHVRPIISISGSDEVESVLQKHLNLKDMQEELDDEGDIFVEEAKPIDDGGGGGLSAGYNTASLHSQSITFMSPLDTQPNAKRQ